MQSAKALFPDWYSRGIKRPVDPSEISILRSVIEKILSKEDKLFWIDLVRLFLGFTSVDDPAVVGFNNLFKEADENFPITNNRNLLRLLAGCTIAQKIELNDSTLSDLLSLSLITGSFGERCADLPITELLEQAESFWFTECESVRAVKENFSIPTKPVTKIPPMPDLTLANGSYGSPTTDSVNKALEQIKTQLNKVIEETGTPSGFIKSVNLSFINIQQALKVRAEEMNVLWWLIGNYCNLQKTPYKKMSTDNALMGLALDLAELTIFIPGLGRVDNIIAKAISQNDIQADSINFFETLNSIQGEPQLLEALKASQEEAVAQLCPYLFAAKCLASYPNENVWKSVFKGKIEIADSLKTSGIEAVNQLYKELMLVKVYNNA